MNILTKDTNPALFYLFLQYHLPFLASNRITRRSPAPDRQRLQRRRSIHLRCLESGTPNRVRVPYNPLSKEASMDKHSLGRRDFMKKMTALNAAGIPVVAGLASRPAHAAYDPAAKFELKVSEVEFRRNAAGRMLMARIYQPQGKAPYPTCVQDANYGVRWLKSKAAGWNGDASKLGVFGSSSGGHVAELLGMRPRDVRYNAIPLPSAPDADATVAYVATRSPISDTFARFQNAEEKKRENMMKNNKTFFVPWETIHESNPQEILERHEQVTLVPLLIMQGALDDNVLPAAQQKFAATYKAAGGQVDFHVFPDSVHEWVAEPGPQTDRAREMVKAFIARNLKT